MENFYDAIVIGGGPAGLTAAIYLARARYRTLVVEKEHFGGQIAITAEVVNYPGIEKTSGEALTAAMRRQAENFGAEFMLAEVTAVKSETDFRLVETSRGPLKAFTVILATGANPRRIGFEGEEEFRGRGVAYCATCDGEFFSGRELLVVGGGFAACEEALFLTRYASAITLLARKDRLTCPPGTAEEVLNHPKIKVKFCHELLSVSGDESGLKHAHIKNNQSGEIFDYASSNGGTFGVFIFAGYVPNTALIKDLAKLDEQGYVITDENRMTSAEGIFAAGDICIKPLRQVVTATADGALAACAAEKLAAKLRERTGIRPQMPGKGRPDADTGETAAAEDNGFISAEMKPQLRAVFERMERSLKLELSLESSGKSVELKNAMEELAALTDRLSLAAGTQSTWLPCVRIMDEAGDYTGLAFHGVPGGHEFTSFVLGLYNAAGPGQQLDEADRARAQSLAGPFRLKVLVSLSCTMCPDLVTAAQRLSCLNANIETEVFDLNLYPDLREKYKVMSVPCLVVNDEHISFGRKTLRELLDYLESLKQKDAV